MNNKKAELRKIILILVILHAIILLIIPMCIYQSHPTIESILINIWIAACVVLFMLPFILFLISIYKK